MLRGNFMYGSLSVTEVPDPNVSQKIKDLLP